MLVVDEEMRHGRRRRRDRSLGPIVITVTTIVQFRALPTGCGVLDMTRARATSPRAGLTPASIGCCPCRAYRKEVHLRLSCGGRPARWRRPYRRSEWAIPRGRGRTAPPDSTIWSRFAAYQTVQLVLSAHRGRRLRRSGREDRR
ncbi:uncharacterized protein BO72DRAFT_105401 [Aspergillus fijiensis CBS 313.89]|uniref:Uncharacterized protein n=1 Tax=Aspergillus fijiensis CBS 313.89 TaxID=1448319 RepID=A0A8G1RR66_9EURO|nr:uncharacterized protein BO72DRAFT_105401 [Aspergillus fijiensis CBS 313.89]RAK77399.1 hypothetical protein BO72DRAFT_105401 [Aspergillus fijiensis CBS 313.89]